MIPTRGREALIQTCRTLAVCFLTAGPPVSAAEVGLAAVPLAAAQSAALALPPAPEPLSLAWCLDRAAIANPETAELKAVAEAAEDRIVPAGALEDPEFRFEASNLPLGAFDFDSTPLSGLQFGLMQGLPFPGLLGERRSAAELAGVAARQRLDDHRRQIGSAVEAVWAELGFAQRALEITDRNVELLRQLTKIAETRYAVGSGLQQDVLRAQVELTALLEERLRRQAGVATAAATLARLLDLPPSARLPRTAPLEQAAPLPVLEPLFDRMVESNALLKALAAKVEEARHAVRVAELEGYPDVDLNLGYRVRRRVTGDPVNGDDFLSAGFSVRLPVNRSAWNARAAERRALLRAATASLRKSEAMLRARLRSSYAELVRADSQAELLRTGLVPQAAQSLDSSRSAYEVGRVDFLALLDSQVRLLDAELRAVRAVADRRVAFASLEALVGKELR